MYSISRTDVGETVRENNTGKTSRISSKLLSKYQVYKLFLQPFFSSADGRSSALPFPVALFSPLLSIGVPPTLAASYRKGPFFAPTERLEHHLASDQGIF